MSFFLFKWAGALAHVFADLFKSAEKAYDKLSEEEKTALQQGVGLVAIINEHLSEAPALIRQKIQERFPELDEAKIEAAIFALAHHFINIDFKNLDDAIVSVQSRLARETGKALGNRFAQRGRRSFRCVCTRRNESGSRRFAFGIRVPNVLQEIIIPIRKPPGP